MNEKIVSAERLTQISAELRAAGKKLVATNGCFDLLHVGHVRYLNAARRLGDALVVGINGDSSVQKLKGPERPINREEDRAEVVAALESVSYVTIFSEERATAFLAAAQPALYVKGGDYEIATLNKEEHSQLEKCGAEVRLLPFEAGYSTSSLIQRLKKSCAA
jgi:D-beta-D-heptose 7-phosphate kinase/D-beta-D-heptose 1-phosphate adenosyltransferase